MLLCVLWALAVLTVLTIGFARLALLDRRAAAVSVDHLQARMYARGAIERAIAEIRNQAYVQAAFRDMQLRQGGQHDLGGPVACWTESPNLFDSGEVFSLEDDPDFRQDSCRYTITDAERRISLNTAPEELLDAIPGISFQTVNAIMARREEESGLRGARPFVTVEELRSLDGVSSEEWSGDDDTPAFRDLFTVWGDGRINLNTASPEVLRCIPDLAAEMIEAIVAFRSGPDAVLYTPDDRAFVNLAEVANRLNLSAEQVVPLKGFCTTESRYYTITALATQRQGRVRATCEAVVALTQNASATVDWREGSDAL